jgi:hypothetical protein
VLKRVVIAGVCLLLVVAGAAPALADTYTSTDCAQNPHPGCELTAGQGGRAAAPRAPGPASTPPSGAAQAGAGPDQPPPGDVSLDPSTAAKCSYVRSDFQPPGDPTQPVVFLSRPTDGGIRVVLAAVYRPGSMQVQTVATGPDGQPGAWYVYQCQTAGIRDALYRPPVWIPDGQAGPAAAPDPAALAQQARSQLRLQGPRIVLSPTARQLVRLPTWMWLDPAGWRPVAATAAVGAASVTAVATPAEVTWSMGDGGQVRCAGPGTPYPVGGDPKAFSPDCGYTYRTVSASQPGGVFTVTATVTWNVTWAGGGQAGVFDGLTTVSAFQATVISIPALTTGGG